MEKVIKIGNKNVRLSNNVAWTMEYRDQFGKDIVPVLMPLIGSMIEGISSVLAEAGTEDIDIESIANALQGRVMDVILPIFQIEFVDVIINVVWAMAKAADEGIDPPKQWVRQFETFPLDSIAPTVYELVLKGFVSSKNLKRLKKAGETLKNLQPLHSMTSSSQESSEG